MDIQEFQKVSYKSSLIERKNWRERHLLCNKETGSESHEKVTVCLHEMRYQGEFCDLIEHLWKKKKTLN